METNKEVSKMKSFKTPCNVSLAIFALVFLFGLFHSIQANQEKPKKEVVNFPGAKPSGKPFSSAIKVGNILFLSGVIGSDLETGELVSDCVIEQTHKCMEKLSVLLKEAGMDFSDAVKATVYLADINDYSKMNEAYGSYFKNTPCPARACIQVAKLVKDAKVEISMMAIKTE